MNDLNWPDAAVLIVVTIIMGGLAAIAIITGKVPWQW